MEPQPGQEVLWWVLSSFWHLLFGSETQSSQTPPTIKMDGRSNKFSSVFGIKTLIKEEEEHLSPGGKDRAPASPAPCPQSPPAQVLMPPGSPQPVPRHVPSSAAPQHPSIAPGTYFPIRSPPEGSQGFWQLLHHKAFSRLLHEHLCSRRAHKYPAAISASG